MKNTLTLVPFINIFLCLSKPAFRYHSYLAAIRSLLLYKIKLIQNEHTLTHRVEALIIGNDVCAS